MAGKRRPMSPQIQAMRTCEDALAELSPEAQRFVLIYLTSTFLQSTPTRVLAEHAAGDAPADNGEST